MLKTLIPHVICIGLMLLLNIVYFFPQLEGKVVQQSDIVFSDQATHTIKEYNKLNNKKYLWNPAQFAGMPTLVNPPSNKNLIINIYSVLKLGFSEPIGLYFAGCLMAYLALLSIGFGPWLSLMFAIPMVFATGNLILWDAGHNSKIRTLIFTPILIAGVLNIFEKRKYLFGFLMLSIGFACSFYTRHPQMTYYIMIVFMIYGFVFLYQTFKSKDWTHFAKGTCFALLAIGLGLSTSATKTWSMYDYSKSSIRGDAILKNDTETTGSTTAVDGVSWDYATAWSNGGMDILASFIPGIAGGGTGQSVKTSSQSFKNYRIRNAPLYWGDLPFTVGPIYIGSTIFFFFILGLGLVNNHIRTWLGIGLVVMILLSMGKHFESLNRIIFDYFPLYSKFRAPQTILNVSSFFIALLAAYGLQSFLKVNLKDDAAKSRAQKILFIAFGATGGLALVLALIGTSLFDFKGLSDGNYINQGVNINHFIEDRKALFTGDCWRTVILIGGLFLLLFAYLKSKISKNLLIFIAFIIVMFDLISVGMRYLDHSKFIKKSTYSQNFAPRDVDNQIMQMEKDKARYRVHDLTINSFVSSFTSRFHNTLGGNDPAKLQRMQDLIERHVSRNNIAVLSMLNTKYLIVPGENGKEAVQQNPNALGNAWFVNNVKKVSSPVEEINALSDTELSTTAVVLESEFPNYISSSPDLDSNSNIDMVAYEPDLIEYSSSSNTDALAVFSEIWYGPNKGWQAYIDGQPVDHIRVNYALRGLKVPAGNHTIKFEFRPKTYFLGETISLISSLIIIGGIFWFLFNAYKNDELSFKNV